MNDVERKEKGLLFLPFGDEEKKVSLGLVDEFNRTSVNDIEKRIFLIDKMFGSVGSCFIEPPIHSNWGLRNVRVGNGVYINFNVTFVDDGNIYIGDNVLIGPNVNIITSGHPINPYLRSKKYLYVKDVHIGNNVWLGAGSIILPGVSIGDNSVIGAGSVVTKDIPSNVVAVGNPCHVLREISEHDDIYFYKDEIIDWDNL